MARSESDETAPVVPALASIPETMLYTLYARAAEARREDGLLQDPDGLRIFDRIDYDFAGRFGAPNRRLALRAASIDAALRRWLVSHPDGLIVSLGEGLETQAARVDNGRMRWLSVDLPEAIALREIFIPPTERFGHLAASATDLGWLDRLPSAAGVCVVAQGLFMYLDQAEVTRLLRAIAERLPGCEVIFDVVSRQTSALTRQGHRVSDQYDLPVMPWGLNRTEIRAAVRRWGLRPVAMEFLPYRFGRRFPPAIDAVLDRVLPSRRDQFSLIRLAF